MYLLLFWSNYIVIRSSFYSLYIYIYIYIYIYVYIYLILLFITLILCNKLFLVLLLLCYCYYHTTFLLLILFIACLLILHFTTTWCDGRILHDIKLISWRDFLKSLVDWKILLKCSLLLSQNQPRTNHKYRKRTVGAHDIVHLLRSKKKKKRKKKKKKD